MGNSIASGVARTLGMSLPKAGLANAPNRDEESGSHEPCHGPLYAAYEASSLLKLRAAGRTPEIPAIGKIARPTDSPSKQPLVLEGVDNGDVRLKNVAKIAVEVVLPPPQLSSSPHALPTPSSE